jgi:hypothetical protein
MGLKGYRLWVMGQLDSNVQSPTARWRRPGRKRRKVACERLKVCARFFTMGQGAGSRGGSGWLQALGQLRCARLDGPARCAKGALTPGWHARRLSALARSAAALCAACCCCWNTCGYGCALVHSHHLYSQNTTRGLVLFAHVVLQVKTHQVPIDDGHPGVRATLIPGRCRAAAL